jgi:hypothetical protein
MVKSPHEALHRIFQEDPGLFSRVFERLLGLEFTEPYSVSVLSPDMTEIKPLERRADTVLMIESRSRSTALIIESQTERVAEKKNSWPYYIAYLHAKHECDVGLLVITAKKTTAEWAREQIRVGIGTWHCMVVRPIVLGPDNVPEITTVEEAAEDVVFALLSAITHGRSDSAAEILEALSAALDTVDRETATLIAEFAEIGLGTGDAREIWRSLMATQTYRYQSEYAEMLRDEGRVEGRVEGEARAVLLMLKQRGVAVPSAARERILSCTDIDVVERWVCRTATATRVEDLFD